MVQKVHPKGPRVLPPKCEFQKMRSGECSVHILRCPCVETDVSPQTDWGSSCTVQVYSYKCIVVTLELWRFQLGSKITLLEMHSFYKLFDVGQNRKSLQ